LILNAVFTKAQSPAIPKDQQDMAALRLGMTVAEARPALASQETFLGTFDKIFRSKTPEEEFGERLGCYSWQQGSKLSRLHDGMSQLTRRK
jgi:hypothetical protein